MVWLSNSGSSAKVSQNMQEVQLKVFDHKREGLRAGVIGGGWGNAILESVYRHGSYRLTMLK